MRFLAPAYLHWLWLAFIPLILWLFRKQARRVQVSTLLFFRSLAREHQESPMLRQIKRWLSLALTLLVLSCIVFSLARPTSDRHTTESGAVVFLLDRSASMSLTQDGKSRLDLAKEAIRQRVIALPDTAIMSLIAYSSGVDVLLSRSRSKRDLIRLLEAVRPLPTEDSADSGWDAARRIAELDRPAEVIHFSDTSLDHPADPPSGVSYHWENVAAEKVTNVGITGFDIRSAAMERNRYEGFLRVGSAAANATTCHTAVEVKLGGRLVQLRELDLKPGAETTLLLPLEGLDGDRLEIQTSTAGDTMPLDDRLLAVLPPLKPLVVAWIAEAPDPFTEIALGGMVEAGRLEMWKGKPEDWPLKDKPDVLVLENWLPGTPLPDVPRVILCPRGGNPDWLLAEEMARGIPVDRIRSLNADHPVVYGVPAARLSLTRTAKISAPAGLEALWTGGGEPLLMAGELNGSRTVVTTFSPSQSEQLALQPAYPLLLANAIYWCADSLDQQTDLRPMRTGDVLSAKGELHWTTWDGQAITTVNDPVVGGAIALNRIGIWETAEGRRGSAVLASKRETDTPKQVATAATPGIAAPAAFAMGGSSLLLWAAFVLVLLESYLFHRQAVY